MGYDQDGSLLPVTSIPSVHSIPSRRVLIDLTEDNDTSQSDNNNNNSSSRSINYNKRKREEEDINSCVICMNAQRNVTYLKCRHLCACENCANKCGPNCPICRTMSIFIVGIMS